MNILSDFKIRLNALVPENAQDQEITNLKELVTSKSKKLDLAETELKKIKKEMTAVKLSQSKLNTAPKVETVTKTVKAEPKKRTIKEKK